MSADAKLIRRLATRAFLEDSERVDEMLDELAQGAALKEICLALDLTYSTVQRWLCEHHTKAYEAAKVVRAEAGIEELERLERSLTNGDDDIGFNEFRELSKSIQWRVERLNPARYSPKQTVDMNVTDKTAVHLAAIRELARVTVVPNGTPIAAPVAQPALTQQTAEPVIVEAQFEEVKDGSG